VSAQHIPDSFSPDSFPPDRLSPSGDKPAPGGDKSVYELLLVDDDSSFRAALRELFEPFFQIIEADCGEAALEIIDEHPVDLALFDMQMRVVTGLDVIRHIKSELPASVAVFPCILITASYTADLVREAEAAHASAVLKKPVKRRDLLSAVSGALRASYNDPTLPNRLGLVS
jgi:CheY-like chemotaxis protein